MVGVVGARGGRYPVRCARVLVRRAREAAEREGLSGVFLATDLGPGRMPELARPETHPPLLSPADRARALDGMARALEELRAGLGPAELPGDGGGWDAGGAGAVVDGEVLAGAAAVLLAGQYAGACRPTGYGERVLQARAARGHPAGSTEYVDECCVAT